MPKLSFNMREGKIIKWLKQEGEQVQEQETILQIETDKSVIDFESQISGILRKIFIKEGETVPVTLPIGIIANKEEDISIMIKEALEILDGISKGEEIQEEIGQEIELKREFLKKEVQSSPEICESVKISPRARKKAKELGIDISLIKNKFSKKIIQEEDIIEFFNKEKNVVIGGIPTVKVIAKEVPYSGMRQIIGNRLSESKLTAPHIYFSTSVDMSNVLGIIESLKKEQEINITINDFLVFVLAKVLTEQPKMNSSLVDNKIVYYSSINIGIAVGLEEGLVVPVIKEAEKKNLNEIAKESKRLITLAHEKRLMPEDYQSGTFTISNLGMFGIEEFTAIINPPESGILAIGSIQRKPVVNSYDQIVIRPILKMTLSVDHRIIDGIVATQFLNSVKKYLFNPGMLLL